MSDRLLAQSAIPTAGDIAAARLVLRERLPVTRLLEAPTLTQRLGAPVYLKLEAELPTGSFKVRGALYALQRRLAEGRVEEVVASSTGNHGAAVAYAASCLGVHATIFLPRNANPVKRARIAALGARIVETGVDLTAAAEAAAEHTRTHGAYYLDDATDARVPAGTATIGCEILEQAPDCATIVVPMGDTALIRGVAAAVRHNGRPVRVVGVQSATAPAYYLSWKAGAAVSTPTCDTIADGLATRTPDARNVAAIRELIDDVVLVSEEELVHAIGLLLLEEHIVAEPAGAAATAAALQLGRVGRSCVVLVTGANLTPALLARVAAAQQRLPAL